jgi:hypothetical protein
MIIYFTSLDPTAVMYGFSEINKLYERLNSSKKIRKFIQENQIDLHNDYEIDLGSCDVFFIKNINTKNDLFLIYDMFIDLAYYAYKGHEDIKNRSRQYKIDSLWDAALSYDRNRKVTKLLTDIKNKCRGEK